jgi:hypothetical protein
MVAPCLGLYLKSDQFNHSFYRSFKMSKRFYENLLNFLDLMNLLLLDIVNLFHLLEVICIYILLTLLLLDSLVVIILNLLDGILKNMIDLSDTLVKSLYNWILHFSWKRFMHFIQGFADINIEVFIDDWLERSGEVLLSCFPIMISMFFETFVTKKSIVTHFTLLIVANKLNLLSVKKTGLDVYFSMLIDFREF